ncbi:hypothetical protein ACJ41O_005485 [Fusarium nematophilum]
MSCRAAYDLHMRTMRFHHKGLVFLAHVWAVSLVVLLFYLVLQSTGTVGVDIGACHPDGEFSPFRNSYNWWAAEGFFQVTLRSEDFSFAGVKMLWNLVVGRGGQSILALIAWRTFAEYLTVSMAVKPVSYRTVWLLKFQTEPSAMSALLLDREFTSPRCLASRTAMFSIIAAALFVLGFPTFVGSMTGYTTTNQAIVELDDTGLVSFSETFPVAYVIHDGQRVGLENDCPVAYKNDQWMYGILSPNWTKDEPDQDTTLWDVDGDNITLSDKPLNISTFYLPDSFITAGLSEKDAGFENPFKNKHNLTYSVSGNFYNLAEIKKHGICHPIRDGLLEFAETVEAQLKSAGIDHSALDDRQLEQEIMKLLEGGMVSSPCTLPRGPYSLRRGLRRWAKDEKVFLGATLCWIPACSVDYAYKAGGGKDGDALSLAAYLSVYVICGTSIVAILSYGMRGDGLRAPMIAL